ncbi:MAG: hypothetical protein WCV85_00085 [Patescibacteria group bacterium]|jgi:hypothetical protein
MDFIFFFAAFVYSIFFIYSSFIEPRVDLAQLKKKNLAFYRFLEEQRVHIACTNGKKAIIRFVSPFSSSANFYVDDEGLRSFWGVAVHEKHFGIFPKVHARLQFIVYGGSRGIQEGQKLECRVYNKTLTEGLQAAVKKFAHIVGATRFSVDNVIAR